MSWDTGYKCATWVSNRQNIESANKKMGHFTFKIMRDKRKNNKEKWALGSYGIPSSGLIYIKEVTEEEERKGIRLFKETMAQNFQLRKHTKFESQ